jgi:tellurite resistance protein
LPGTDKITVVAKSGGEISANEEKEAILDEIAKALDEILNSANSLEQVEDTDLDK